MVLIALTGELGDLRFSSFDPFDFAQDKFMIFSLFPLYTLW
jgi:hypothetical protein